MCFRIVSDAHVFYIIVTFFADTPKEHGIFDDMALLLANRTPGTGLTPGLSDFNSWWDINAGDLMLSPGQTMPMHQRNPFDELPNTSAAAPDVAQQQQISQDSYFGQFWGE